MNLFFGRTGFFNFTKAEKYTNVDYIDLWKQMEKLVDAGLVKSLGVSNFNIYQINRIIKECRIKPVMNQIEVHAWLNQSELIKDCAKHGIKITAYGRPG